MSIVRGNLIGYYGDGFSGTLLLPPSPSRRTANSDRGGRDEQEATQRCTNAGGDDHTLFAARIMIEDRAILARDLIVSAVKRIILNSIKFSINQDRLVRNAD